jgi:hypothetical protein
MLKGFRFGFSAFTGTKNFRISISEKKQEIFRWRIYSSADSSLYANCRDSGWLIVGLAACMVPAAGPTNRLNWAGQHREHGAFVDERALKFAASPEAVE